MDHAGFMGRALELARQARDYTFSVWTPRRPPRRPSAVPAANPATQGWDAPMTALEMANLLPHVKA